MTSLLYGFSTTCGGVSAWHFGIDDPRIQGESGEAGGNKALSAEAALALLRQIRKTAVAIAEAEEMPEFDDKFVVPRSNAFEGVLASARTFLSEATPHSALFIDFALPADFLTKLQQIIVRMEKAATDKDDGLLEQVGGTAELAENATGGMKARKQLLTLVSNTYVGATGTLAEWKTASHIVWPQSGGDSSPAGPEQVN